jgi:hypothetical protein
MLLATSGKMLLAMQEKTLEPHLHKYELRESSGAAKTSTNLSGTKWKSIAAPTMTTPMGPQTPLMPTIDKFELRPCTSYDSFREPSPKLRTSKEEEIQPLEFSHIFEDDSPTDIINVSNHYRHENPTTSTDLYEVLSEVWMGL